MLDKYPLLFAKGLRIHVPGSTKKGALEGGRVCLRRWTKCPAKVQFRGRVRTLAIGLLLQLFVLFRGIHAGRQEADERSVTLAHTLRRCRKKMHVRM